ncbi:MAG: hypothetical protein Q4E58_05670 [Prevotellaceae bacterium]|nr:hypothetical protein [Prevotellaceae bacterium]
MELITALFVCAYSYILCECILSAVRITAQCMEKEDTDADNTENNLDKNNKDNENTNRDLEKD